MGKHGTIKNDKQHVSKANFKILVFLSFLYSVSFCPMREQTCIYKNNLVIALAFLLQFTAYNGIGNLQSSINCVDGLGTYTIATIYASLIVSCLFMPTVLIQKLGLKWTLAISFTGYLIYTACNFYPSFETLIPAAILLGFGAAPLWSSQCQYLTVSATRMAKLEGGTPETW